MNTQFEDEQQTTEALLAALRMAGRTPDLGLMRVCRRREEDLREPLLEMLVSDPYEAYDLPADSDDPRIYARIHAGHLLLAWQDPDALPRFASIFRDEEAQDLVEWFNPWLHEYGAAVIDPFLEVAGDTDVHWFGRAAATELLSATGQRFPETKEEIVAGLQALLPSLTAEGRLPEGATPDEVWTWAAIALSEMGVEEVLPQIKKLYRAGLIDQEIAGDLDAYLGRFGKREDTPRPFNLLDVYRYLHKQAEAERARRAKDAQREQVTRSREYERSAPDEPLVRTVPKVGRNDPCPCGSGRKYKRCHGRPGR